MSVDFEGDGSAWRMVVVIVVEVEISECFRFKGDVGVAASGECNRRVPESDGPANTWGLELESKERDESDESDIENAKGLLNSFETCDMLQVEAVVKTVLKLQHRFIC